MSLARCGVAIYLRAGRRTCGTEDVAFRLRAGSAVRRVKSGEAEGLVPTCARVQALNGANPPPEYVDTCRRCGACPAAPAAAVVAAIVVGEAVRRAAHRGGGRRSRGGRGGPANPEQRLAMLARRLDALTATAAHVRRALPAVRLAAAVGTRVPWRAHKERGDEHEDGSRKREGAERLRVGHGGCLRGRDFRASVSESREERGCLPVAGGAHADNLAAASPPFRH